MSYFKVYNIVFTAQMIVPRHIPLPSLVLKFPSLPAVSAAITHRAHPSSLLKKTCSSSSLTAAFSSPAFCAITHPSLAVTPGLGRPFPKPVQLISIAANAQFYLLGSFSDVFMSWTSSWRSQGQGEQWGMRGQEHGRRWELLASCCSINHPLGSLRSFMQAFPISLRLDNLDLEMWIIQKNSVHLQILSPH